MKQLLNSAATALVAVTLVACIPNALKGGGGRSGRIALGVTLVVATFWATTRTNASAAGGTTTFGTFTWGVTQRGRLIVTAPTTSQWSAGRAGEVVLGFDVSNTDVNAGQPASGSCVKWHMIERQACQVLLSPGEAASLMLTATVYQASSLSL
ncbi:MAG TPA: hypothetical protein VGV87_19450 [Blastocatellia bacterium]|jgi:hypothetical protein|nr:hypothetical protein [Blastocatellia bacterium]